MLLKHIMMGVHGCFIITMGLNCHHFREDDNLQAFLVAYCLAHVR